MQFQTEEKLKDILTKLGLLSAAKYCYRLHYYLRHIEHEKQGDKRIHGWDDRRFSEIKKYSGIHKGERCFIIATGPSLKIEDIEKLRNEYTISMNSIIKLFDKTDWRPTYYGIQDSIVYEKLSNDEEFKKIKNKFIADFITEEHKVGEDCIVYPLDLLNHLYYKPKRFDIKFSDNAYRIVYDGSSVTYSLIQIAVYMGFKEIYLLGCDCNYSGEKQHFEDYGVKVINSPEKNMLIAYKAAKEYADSHNIKIYNATRGGKLEVFERVNLDDVV